MGCDIHAHVEVKIKGVWHHYNHPRIGRLYSVFGRMAGVRGEAEPIAPPRGIPDDSTFMTRFDFDRWGEDAHDASWLSCEEVAALSKWANELHKEEKFWDLEHHHIGYIFGSGWDIKKYPDDYPEGVEDARLIFWFDN